jgi:hypothetical protein
MLFAVPPHSLGESFVPSNQDEADDELLAYAEMFKVTYGVQPEDFSPEYADILTRRQLAELEALNAAHDRWWADVQRRRTRYGYGVTGRIREWWGER